MPPGARLEPWARGTPPRTLSETLFDGRLVLFEDLPAVSLLVGRGRAILERVFGTDDPVHAENGLSAAAFRRLALKARNVVGTDAEVARHWRDTLATVGYHPEDAWLDRIRLRAVPSRTDVDHPRLQVLPPHRDTWGSGIAAQVNWWLPLFPLSETRTMLLWPDAFRRPVPNDSGDWSFEAFREGASRDYPLLPVAGEAPPTPAMPVSMAPGQLLAFSAAHLHGGVRDASGMTRFGIDTRTVWDPDRRAGRGAPNVDCAAGTEMWRWYSPPREALAEGRP
ncbi:MAG: hypothetical protein OXM56_14675 [Gammaproteobacteria bacterium]|nr:hypothetical protein [Gammaproteobacteria bacterium]